MCHPRHQRSDIRQFIATFACVVWFATERCEGQSRETAFGTERRIAVPGRFERSKLLKQSTGARPSVVLWTPGHSELFVCSFDSVAVAATSQRYVSPTPFDDVIPADVNNDGVADFLLLSKKERAISVALRKQADSLQVVSTISLPFVPTEILPGDINDDRNIDIIAFGRNNPGILPMFGNGKGRFTAGRIIAPDNPVSHAAFTHLNNDRLVDLVFYDWVKSELHLLFGVGHGRFLEQGVLTVQGDVRSLLTVEKKTEGVVDFILVTGSPNQLQIWQGNGLGDFEQAVSIPLQELPEETLAEDINGDRQYELVTAAAGSLDVFLNPGEGATERINFFLPGGTSGIALADVNRDGKLDLLVSDTSNQEFTVLFNARQPNILRDSMEFATGPHPSAVWMGDANGDGHTDVVVANEGGGTISFFFGRKEEGLLGQASYVAAPNPQYLMFHSREDSLARFVISYPLSKALSFFSLNVVDNSSVNAIIPSDGESEVLFSSTATDGSAEFFCTNSPTASTDASLSHYRQISQKTFVERMYRLTSPDSLLGVTVADMNDDGNADLVYVYRTLGSAALDVGIAYLDSSQSVRQRTIAAELPAVHDRKCYVWTADFNGDGVVDLVIAFPQTAKRLVILKGRKDGTFEMPRVVLEGMTVADRTQLQILDVDRDSVPDIVVNDEASTTIGWLRGTGEGTFAPWQALAATERGSHFAPGDLNNDGIIDLAFTLPKSGVLKMMSGTLLWRNNGVVKK